MQHKHDYRKREEEWNGSEAEAATTADQWSAAGARSVHHSCYAVDLLVPFIPAGMRRLWEPAAGIGFMARRFMAHGFAVTATDLHPQNPEEDGAFVPRDFLAPRAAPPGTDLVVTNPPFSLKEQFARRCMGLGLPWALLIPMDVSSWLCEAVEEWGCRMIWPTRRIDFITPNMLVRVFRGETLKAINAFRKAAGLPLRDKWAEVTEDEAERFATACYERLEDVPIPLMRKYSQAQFHSDWLTLGLDVPATVKVVPLEKADKDRIFPGSPLPSNVSPRGRGFRAVSVRAGVARAE